MFYTYAIYNKDRDKIYIGQTNNLANRIDRHNQKLPTKSTAYTTKNNGCWELIYHEEFFTREEAVKREKQLKSYQGRRYIRSIILEQKS